MSDEEKTNVQLIFELRELRGRFAVLQSQEEVYRDFFENLPIGLYQVTPRGRILRANRHTAIILGYDSPTELIDAITDIGAQIYQEPGKREEVRRLLRGNNLIENFEVEFRRKDGRPVWVALNARIVRNDDGNVLYHEGMIKDITRRKGAEVRMEEALREKENLLHEIHHRVKNNLQVVASILDLQAVSGNTPEAVEAARSSYRRVKAMSLIHEMLYQSKDIGLIDLPAYVSDLARDIFLAHLINPGTITLSIRKKDDVLLDIDQALPCGLVLNELIANAVKHAFPGGRKGEITVEIDRSQDDDIEIVMADNGAGLPAAVDPLRSRTVGLHLIRGLVKHQLHGRLEVRSGPGTTYRICFRSRSDRRKG